MSNVIQNTYEIFTDVDGTPLEDGYIFIGVAGEDPLTNPLQAYWDEALTVPADDIRTKGGYPVNSGAISRLYTASNCSVLVQNKRGTLIYPRLDSKKTGTTKVIYTGPLATVSTPENLISGEKFSDWDLIHVSFSVSNDSALNASEYRIVPFIILPNSFRCYSDSGFLQFGYISDTSFQLTSKTTVGNLGNISRIIGISL